MKRQSAVWLLSLLCFWNYHQASTAHTEEGKKNLMRPIENAYTLDAETFQQMTLTYHPLVFQNCQALFLYKVPIQLFSSLT
jgi:hypothetical protein